MTNYLKISRRFVALLCSAKFSGFYYNSFQKGNWAMRKPRNEFEKPKISWTKAF